VVSKVIVRAHEYHDSVRLMQVSQQVRREAGVQETILMMGTDNNKKILATAGLSSAEIEAAAANDLIVAIVADHDAAAKSAIEKANVLLMQSTSGASSAFRSFDTALGAMPGANLALISIPGAYAAAEARRALEQGLHVMLFSDNVAIEDELELKRLARDKGLLVMGPDCGTTVIGQARLGFANVVKQGPVGIVGASGTGIQELSVLLHQQGVGISHAIGTGGRDLDATIGGITMLAAIDLLEADASTEIIVLTSKPPDPNVAEKVIKSAAGCSKPVVVNFLGGNPEMITAAGLTPARTLEDAANEVFRLVAVDAAQAITAGMSDTELRSLATKEAQRLLPEQAYLRGLFSGGTLCYEAILILQEQIGDVYSNIPLNKKYRLTDTSECQENTVLDLGDDVFTEGRAHPMIDPTMRNERLLQELQDPELGVVLLDVVLGFGAHANPVEDLIDAIKQSRDRAVKDQRQFVVVASVCGTEEDPQRRSTQARLLRDAGVLVANSNAEASRLAGAIIRANNEGLDNGSE
jgi:FdrA protein